MIEDDGGFRRREIQGEPDVYHGSCDFCFSEIDDDDDTDFDVESGGVYCSTECLHDARQQECEDREAMKFGRDAYGY